MPADLRGRVLRPADRTPVDRGGGASTVGLVGGPEGATTFLNGITSFQPGARIGHHLHNCAESVLVLDGHAVVDIDGWEVVLEPDDVTFVPGGVPHHFRNASDRSPMRIFWTYGSTAATRTVLATGRTIRVDGELGGAPGGQGTVETFDLAADGVPLPTVVADLAAVLPALRRAPGCRSAELFRGDDGTAHLRLEWSGTSTLAGALDAEGLAAWTRTLAPYLAASVGRRERRVWKGL